MTRTEMMHLILAIAAVFAAVHDGRVAVAEAEQYLDQARARVATQGITRGEWTAIVVMGEVMARCPNGG